MNRLGCMLAALIAAVVLGVGLVAALPQETEGTSAAEVAAPFAAELALASAQGLTVLEEGVVDGPAFVRVVTLRAEQCVALIVMSIGPDVLTAAALSADTGSTGERASSVGGTSVHTAICASQESSISASFRLGDDRAHYGASTARYAILTGPTPADPSSYPRLSMSPGMRASLDTRALLARGRALLGDGTRIRESITIAPQRALLLPVSSSTYAARRVISGFGTRVPEIVTAPGDPIDPFQTPTDIPSLPTMFTGTGTLRLLLALDAGALGSDCISVALIRLDDPLTAIPVTRIALPSLQETSIAGADPAIAIDVVCPAEGLFAYGVPANVGGDYGLEVLARSAPAGARPLAVPLGPLELPLVSERRRACAAGAETACIDLAVLARDGVHGAGTPDQALRPYCDAHGGASCALMAGLLLESAPAAADRFERRACATGVLPSCLRHAATLRRAGRLDDSLRTYRFACERGEATSCAAVSTFAEWSIAPPVEVPSAERLP